MRKLTDGMRNTLRRLAATARPDGSFSRHTVNGTDWNGLEQRGLVEPAALLGATYRLSPAGLAALADVEATQELHATDARYSRYITLAEMREAHTKWADEEVERLQRGLDAAEQRAEWASQDSPYIKGG